MDGGNICLCDDLDCGLGDVRGVSLVSGAMGQDDDRVLFHG